MAKTQDGKMKIHVKPYTKQVKGKTVEVKRHYRSTPN